MDGLRTMLLFRLVPFSAEFVEAWVGRTARFARRWPSMSVINVMFLNSILSLADGVYPEGKSIGNRLEC